MGPVRTTAVLAVVGLSPARLLDPACILLVGLGLALLLTGGAVLRHPRRRVRFAGRFALGIWGVLWLASLPAVSHRLTASVEAPAADPSSALRAKPENQRAIVVLSGGMRRGQGSGPQALGLVTAARVMGAAELYHQVPVAYVICSGTDISQPERAMSESMASALIQQGVPADRIVLEPWSRDTRENALYSTMLIEKLPIEVVAVVTSAVHMPRAQQEFEQQGLGVVARAGRSIGPVGFRGGDVASSPAWPCSGPTKPCMS